MSLENQRIQTLEYNYVYININTGLCIDVFTQSYQIPSTMTQFVEIPVFDGNYEGKYYNLNGDKRFYWDAEFTQLWEECPSHNV